MTDLDDLRAQFADIRADFDRLMFGMRKVQFNWRPAPGRWSIGDCLAHLNAVDSLDADLLEAAVRQARAKGLTGDGPFRYSPVTGWLIRSLEPPPRFRTRAPRIYLPPPGKPMLKIRGDFIRIHDRLVEIAGLAEGLRLTRVKVPAPFIPWLKFSFTQRMRLIAAHDRRHLWQAWQVPSTPGFPT